MSKILLNCDMGEHYGVWVKSDDEKLMPYIDIANLACGFHASDPINIVKSVQLTKKYSKSISIHPSYPDMVGFGRRSMKCSLDEISALILYQCGALEAICKTNNIKIKYIKPHGALYNDMMGDMKIFETIVKTIASFNKNLKLLILSTAHNKKYKKIAKKYGIELLYEVFMDRNYNDEGFLVSRTEPNSVIHNPKIALKRIKTLLSNGYIESVNGKKLNLKVDTICVHGDHDEAVEFVKVLRDELSNS
ncbi:MAG: 5-oxoprolinase subunit PxpA [Campylobacterota bacterium]|nr:5-oxoprolinase subunit PxpA [Campylobacterota bacterium]